MNIETLINTQYSTFSENDKYICRCILENKEICHHLSIEAFANKFHISRSSLSRFAQKLTLPGYSELKALLRMEKQEISLDTNLFLQTALNNYHKMIDDINQRDCSELFQKMDNAKRILIYGSGYGQARVAKEFKRIFLPIGKIIYDIHGHDMSKPFISMVKENDLVFIISLSGESKGIIDVASKLDLLGMETVSITRMQSNSLSKLCKENLYIHSLTLPTTYTIEYESTAPYFILIELLYIKYRKHIEHILK